MQHIIIHYDEQKQEPFLHPGGASLWRDDQSVMWSFDPAAPNVWWDPAHPQQIEFDDAASGATPWPGSIPSPIGPAPGEKDRRRVQADAGSPNFGTTPERYVYTAFLEWETASGERMTGAITAREHLAAAGIDPDIYNRPQP